jgi:hypothetical protein
LFKSDFAYETVFPLLIVGTTSLLAISTVTSEINFFTRLLRMRDKTTNLPLFSTLSVTLACNACRENGKAAECPHMLHLVPRWQSGERHIKLKTVMQDRPDLIESELSGLAFDSLQQVFRSVDLDIMFSQLPPSPITNEPIHLFIDPAAGGPGSDYSILSVTRQKGMITVSGFDTSFCLPTTHESFLILILPEWRLTGRRGYFGCVNASLHYCQVDRVFPGLSTDTSYKSHGWLHRF